MIIDLLILVYITWVYYTAVMRLREVRDAGKLELKRNPIRVAFAYATLLIGLVLDTIVNLIACTLISGELPKIELHKGLRGFLRESEWLTTARLNRWYSSSDDSLIWRWRSGVAKWTGAELLDDIDPDGKHVKG